MAGAFIAKPQSMVRETGNMFAIALEAVRKSYRVKDWWREYVDQCWFISKVCAIPVILISLPFGMVIALHVGSFNRQLGAEAATGAAMVLAIVREAAAVAIALIIAGAAGSAMTADLGSRRIRDEIAAMEVMAINPVHRLVTPRLLASATISVLLVPLVCVAGLAGGFMFNVVVQGTTAGAYFSGFTALVQIQDLYSALIKAGVFGFIAAMVACYKGLYCKGGPKGVGDAVNQAVVVTFILVFFANFILTTLYFALVPQKF
jgi:phospholipid/cholesterol/gamma-HCH transport system permease protein